MDHIYKHVFGLLHTQAYTAFMKRPGKTTKNYRLLPGVICDKGFFVVFLEHKEDHIVHFTGAQQLKF